MKISQTHYATRTGIVKRNPSKITDIDSIESHKIWKKVQDRLGISSGDVDPMFHFRLENQMKNRGGYTRTEYEKIITNYYTALSEIKKERIQISEDAKSSQELEKTIFGMWKKAENN